MQAGAVMCVYMYVINLDAFSEGKLLIMSNKRMEIEEQLPLKYPLPHNLLLTHAILHIHLQTNDGRLVR